MGKALKIREVGDPILSVKCDEVNINNISSEILEDIEDLIETLSFTEGFGIAGPQVGISKRIVIIQVDKEKCKYKNSEEIPTTVMLNPIWKPLSDETDFEYEGCLSVPEIRGKVERYTNIEVTYYNEKGEKIVKQVRGFTARDIQHECDHLDGILFLEKSIKFATKEMVNKFNLNEM